MSLEHDALRYYYKHLPVITHYPLIVSEHYYLLIKRNGILFHCESVVTFCHVFNPEQFNLITRRTMRLAFPRHQVLAENGYSMSFRVVSMEEFDKIVKGVAECSTQN